MFGRQLARHRDQGEAASYPLDLPICGLGAVIGDELGDGVAERLPILIGVLGQTLDECPPVSWPQ